MIRLSDVTFSYRGGTKTLDRVSLDVKRGEFVAIQGRSGSGKSTLFYLLGCLLHPDSGQILIDGVDVTRLSADEQARFRHQRIGFVFQQFHLLPRATVLENILLPSRYGDRPTTAADETKARELARQLGIEHRLAHHPNQLSGGEQQRVAVARALMTDAPILLADEPTGNLDTKNAESAMALFDELHAQGKTILLITHDPEVAKRCPRICHIVDGKFIDETIDPTERAISPPPHFALSSWWNLVKTAAPLALQNLRRNRVRTALTMTGVAVGIASLFSMVTFGQFAKEKILAGYESLGVNSVSIWGHGNWRRKATDAVDVIFSSFHWQRDILALPRIFPEIKRLTPVLTSWNGSANFGGRRVENDVTTFGVSHDYPYIFGRELSEGRFFTPHHVSSASPVCLIGSDIAKRLYPTGSPIGTIVFVTKDSNAFPCRVLGVLKPQNSNKDWAKPNFNLIIPFTYFKAVSSYWESNINQFGAQFASGTDIEKSGKAVEGFFRRKYGQSGEFNVDADALLLNQMRRFLTLFAVLLTSIAVITLGVGAMGINNMMLVSVAERLKEIGLRKAVGATDASVRAQFLLESTFLSCFAGLLGVIFGFAGYQTIIYVASKFVTQLEFEWVVEPTALIASLVSMLVVGIASGIVPALKAERLQVIEALRSE